MAQRSNFVIIDVEFAEGYEPGISNDKANNPITECLVTVILSGLVVESPHQGKSIRGDKLCQIFLDEYILHDGSSGGGGRERVK